MRIKLVFSYDGSKFNGFQRQNDVRSVQKEIENALSKILGEQIQIKGAGRTDAGVHAYGQCAHFDTDNNIKGLKIKLNNLLMPDIVVKKVQVVPNAFHARLSAQKKEYIYKINLGPFQAALNEYYYQPRYKLDLKLMEEAANEFLGIHDFRNFVSGEKENPVTNIYSITFKKRFNKLEIHFIGAGFYRYMIRNLVGAILEVGKYNTSKEVIKKMLDNPLEPKSLPTAPAEGLYLNKIWY